MNLWKKKSSVEQLNESIERIDNLIFDLRMKKKQYERKIKKYIKEGKTPPPALLVGWKTTKNIITTMEGYVASLYNSLMLNELGEVFKTVTGKSTIEEAMKALEKIFADFKDVETVMKELTKQQETMLKSTQRISENIAERSDILEEITSSIGSSVTEDVARSILQEFAVTLPSELQEQVDGVSQKMAQKIGESEQREKTTLSNN